MITRRLFCTAAGMATLAGPALAQKAPLPPVKLYKNPQCGCCESYADYLRQHGFAVTVTPTNDLPEMDRVAGIPSALEGCHLSLMGDYFVSGHVPIVAVNKLLTEHPKLKGITLPGMPPGSPGMMGTKQAPFTIYAIGADGRSSTYMTL